MLKIGDKAPDFKLNDKNGTIISLSDFAGKKIIIYFYPKDNTPGCTRQACAYATRNSEFEQKGIVVIAISKDSVESHKKFADKYSLPFILLSDPDLEVINAYGVWKEKTMYGKKTFGVVRTTFIIDENGYIEHIMPKVKPDTNAEEILSLIG